jgi:hypothetical protein
LLFLHKQLDNFTMAIQRTKRQAASAFEVADELTTTLGGGDESGREVSFLLLFYFKDMRSVSRHAYVSLRIPPIPSHTPFPSMFVPDFLSKDIVTRPTNNLPLEMFSVSVPSNKIISGNSSVSFVR